MLRIDNGGEFTYHDFDDFCRDAGIMRELTVLYNSQQNGVAEKKNKSICEATKAMIHDQDLLMSLMAEASSIDVYVQNTSPHRILWDKTLKEAFIGVKPKVSHFRIFGCLVYIHVPKERRTKMELVNAQTVGVLPTSKFLMMSSPKLATSMHMDHEHPL